MLSLATVISAQLKLEDRPFILGADINRSYFCRAVEYFARWAVEPSSLGFYIIGFLNKESPVLLLLPIYNV